jgi:hypothetical protein
MRAQMKREIVPSKSLFCVMLLLVGILPGCESSDSSQTQQVTGKSLTELQDVPRSNSPSLVSVFGVAPSDNIGAIVAFYSDNRYFSGVALRLSQNVYRMAAVIGYYEQIGNVIKVSPQKTTCQQLAQKYKGKSMTAGTVNGTAIALTAGAVTAVFSRLDVSSFPASQQGLLIHWGCFDEMSGAFTPQAWSDV